MSADEDQLVFESFLRKRKDRMRLKWATYWFRLQTTTLRFYSQKPGSSSQPKGEYYMWMIQSVREVQKSEGKRFAFEISLKNGKKKQLAADTADLRQTWVDLLWKALQSPGPQKPDPAGIRQEGVELRQEGAGSIQAGGGAHSAVGLIARGRNRTATVCAPPRNHGRCCHYPRKPATQEHPRPALRNRPPSASQDSTLSQRPPAMGVSGGPAWARRKRKCRTLKRMTMTNCRAEHVSIATSR
ncbi:hypothetical protein GJAV_G00223630 [Gymnothorax javanicus]|nr:hypothetical protein GJAV_G00223630 [Gymnothorax javanicus]